MFQDYKVAYSEEGDTHKEEAQSTVTVGWGRGFKSHPVHFYLLYNYGIGLRLISIIVRQNLPASSLVQLDDW